MLLLLPKGHDLQLFLRSAHPGKPEFQLVHRVPPDFVRKLAPTLRRFSSAVREGSAWP